MSENGNGEEESLVETVEETYETEVRRKVIKTKMKIQETSSTTTTTTMTTPAKLYGKDLSVYEDVDVDTLLDKLTPEEINILAKEVDPDDSFLPPSQRTSYDCDKEATGPLNRKQLIEHINKEAIETPDRPELKPYVAGVVRGKKWIPPPPTQKDIDADEKISVDLGDEYEHALSGASQEEIIDLAAILGFHSMMNQDQYHASLLNKGQPVGLGWDGITKASKQKIFPMDPPNSTDVEDSIRRVQNDDPKYIDLNWNNIKNISDEKFTNLFEGLEQNTHLETLSLSNTGLTDRNADKLAQALEKNSQLRVVNVESNNITPLVVVRLIKSLLKQNSVEEFRATNQRSQILGNKIEMEITQLIEKNPTILRLGLHLEYNDARHRIATHLQRNIDTIRKDLKMRLQFRFFTHRNKSHLIKTSPVSVGIHQSLTWHIPLGSGNFVSIGRQEDLPTTSWVTFAIIASSISDIYRKNQSRFDFMSVTSFFAIYFKTIQNTLSSFSVSPIGYHRRVLSHLYLSYKLI